MERTNEPDRAGAFRVRAYLDGRVRDVRRSFRAPAGADPAASMKRAALAALPEDGPDHLRQVITTLSSVLVESLVEHPEERLVLGGTANLARQGADATSLRGVLEALEEQVVVLRLLTASSSDPAWRASL